MSSLDPHAYATHEVFNQPPALADYDAYGADPVLQSVVRTLGADWAEQKLHAAGRHGRLRAGAGAGPASQPQSAGAAHP